LSAIIRRADISESDEIARIHRECRETALPFLPVLHTLDEDRAFFRTRVFPACEIWVSDDSIIMGFIAFREGWVDHLYIHPRHNRLGHGRALTRVAKERYSDLQLWTFQRNRNAILFYETEGFRLMRETDGSENEEREPDALYRWTR
jgi:ribosomal protein S18 acetylase RimI-like enzyme